MMSHYRSPAAFASNADYHIARLMLPGDTLPITPCPPLTRPTLRTAKGPADPIRRVDQLPLEIWVIIFRHATAVPNFFDTRWNGELRDAISPFDESSSQRKSAFDAFTTSVRTKKSIALVCKQWRSLSWELIYSHIVIRRRGQLCTLVRRIEDSAYAYSVSLSEKPTHGVGWHITHLKLLLVTGGEREGGPNGAGAANPPRRSRPAQVDADGSPKPMVCPRTGRRGRGADFVEPEDDTTANLVRRLLGNCPRLEVLLDAAPYASDEPPRPVLAALSTPVHSSSAASSSALLATPISSIRALEWNYGCPSITSLLDPAHATAVNSLQSLRCTAITDPDFIFSTVQGQLREEGRVFVASLPEVTREELEAAEGGSLPLNKLVRPLLSMQSLVALDLFLSARTHQHWAVLASATTITLSSLISTSPSLSASSSFASMSSSSSTSLSVLSSPPPNGLPALRNLTIRTPSSLGTLLPPAALQSLHLFLRAYGPQLKVLDLRICPGDLDWRGRLPDPPRGVGVPHLDPAMGGGPANGNANAMISVPLLLARCPNLEDLILSARWPVGHSNAAVGSAPADSNVSLSTGPFGIPFHASLKRIGLRDTVPGADGYSTTLATRPCGSCRRVHMLDSTPRAMEDGTEPRGSEMPYRVHEEGEDVSGVHWYDGHGMTKGLSSVLGGMFTNPSSVVDSVLESLSGLASTGPTASSPSLSSHSFVPSISTPSPFAPMSHRHCTIDRHLRTILSGAPPLCPGPSGFTQSAQVDRERTRYVPPFVRDARDERMNNAVSGMLEQGERDIFGGPPTPVLNNAPPGHSTRHARTRSQHEEETLRRSFGASPRFPSLEAVQLLDSDARMMFPPRQSNLTVEHAGLMMDEEGRCGSTVCPCSGHDARVEMNFWGAWAARSGMRGVKLLDCDGRDVKPIWAEVPSKPKSSGPSRSRSGSWSMSTDTTSSLSSVAESSPTPTFSAFTALPTSHLVEAVDLDAELNQSIIRAALNRHVHNPSVTFRSTALRPLRSTYAAASALLSVALSSKPRSQSRSLGADDRDLLRGVVGWFADRGVLPTILSALSGVRDFLDIVQFLLETTLRSH